MRIDPEVISAVANVVLAAGAITGGWWAASTYKEAKELEAARWQKQLFDSLFLSGKFDRIRDALDRNFDSGLARKIELSVQGHEKQLTAPDRALLMELDNFLNLLEYMLYLEQDQKQIDANDREALFGYWVKLFRSPAYSTVRHYASNYGYERVASLIGASGDTFLLLYGTLREDQPKFKELGLDKALKFVSESKFDGDLYNFGEFPGAVPGTRKITAELYRVDDPSIFATLDEYEEFDADNPDDSLYVRRCIHVPDFGDAWVYLYNGDVERGTLMPSGDWAKEMRSRE